MGEVVFLTKQEDDWRHWYSVQLVLRGEDIAQIQFWRGDKNPERAFAYLQDKGDLVRELESANEYLAEIIMTQGEVGIDCWKEYSNLFSAAEEIAEVRDSLYKNDRFDRMNLLEYMDTNDWFGVLYTMIDKAPVIRRKDFEKFKRPLTLWLSAYKKPGHEKINLMLEYFSGAYPKTCTRLRDLHQISYAYANAGICEVERIEIITWSYRQ